MKSIRIMLDHDSTRTHINYANNSPLGVWRFTKRSLSVSSYLILRFSHLGETIFLAITVAGRYSGAAAEGFYIVLSLDTFSTFKCMFVPTFSKLARQRFIPEIAARKQIHVDVARSNRILVLEFRLYGVSGFDEYSKRSRFYLLLILFSLSNTCSCQYRIALRFIFHRNLNFSASFMPMEICSFYNIYIFIYSKINLI